MPESLDPAAAAHCIVCGVPVGETSALCPACAEISRRQSAGETSALTIATQIVGGLVIGYIGGSAFAALFTLLTSAGFLWLAMLALIALTALGVFRMFQRAPNPLAALTKTMVISGATTFALVAIYGARYAVVFQKVFHGS